MVDNEIESNYYNADDEPVNPRAHKNLLQAISSLGKVQHIKRATRNESEKQPDEFQLVKQAYTSETKASSASEPGVEVNDIFQLLKHSGKHIDVGKKLRNVASSTKVLPVPLEKPSADRIKRTIGYDNVKKKLARWDAVVAKNRSSETQVFSSPTETIFIDTSVYAKPLQLAVKSDMILEMEATDAKLEALRKERDGGDMRDQHEVEAEEQRHLQVKLTRDELIARRKELALLKLRESQKSAKARRQNKIKSKKFHNLLKRQKMQEQIKEFELLQKTNPEAALEKLNILEKNRVLERANLRHKNTGTWAKNLQIRAKYDKDVRKDLSEQLQISRQLTQKKHESDEEEEEQGEGNEQIVNGVDMKALDAHQVNDPFNPWMNASKADAKNSEPAPEAANYRKYWAERNKHKQLLEEFKEQSVESVADVKNSHKDIKAEINEPKNTKTEINAHKNTNTGKTSLKNIKTEKNSLKNIKTEKNALKNIKTEKKTKPQRKLKEKKSAKTKPQPKIENGWIVEVIPANKSKAVNIDDIFDAVEDKQQRKLNKKIKLLSKEAKRLSKAPVSKEKKKLLKKDRSALKQLDDLTFKEKATRPILDEPLNAEDDKEDAEKNSRLKEILAKEANTTKKTSNVSDQTDVIDPTKIAPIKLKQFVGNLTAMDAADYDDDEAADNNLSHQQMTISQAFVDDDIVADFSKDKSDKSKLPDTEIQLSLPGWGSWAGAGISKEQVAAQKNKRLVLKLAPQEKRRDENKGSVYVNEEASKSLRTHLVSDLPFPFTSLQDYEASIRAPIGRNFVTETAFRMLTKPAVITRKGTIIDPMQESELLKRPGKPRNVVEKRIMRMQEVEAKTVKLEGI